MAFPAPRLLQLGRGHPSPGWDWVLRGLRSQEEAPTEEGEPGLRTIRGISLVLLLFLLFYDFFDVDSF